MTKLFALNRKQTVGFVSLALVLAAGVAIAASPATNQQSKPGAATDQHRGPGHRGFDPFARWDQDHDGKLVLKDLPSKPQAHLATIDANKDGTLTREEFDKGKAQLRTAREKEFDTNKDGKVSDDERKAAMRAHFDERFTEEDKNHDGYLSADELPKPRYEQLKVADTNKDNKLSKAEIETAFTNGTLGPRGQGHERGKGPMNDADRKAQQQRRFAEDDKNHDGFLVQTEVPERWDHLKVADSNNDNKVTLAELKAAFESGKMGPPRHGRGQGEGHGQGHGHSAKR
jgi:Ca2+-binding EF-hand superfamily protein